jgi:uncharacterized DUF497 family protein
MMQFEWDEAKARSNRRKHGISFEEAAQVFSDPYVLAEQDRVEGGEFRWQTMGLVEGVVVLLVVHTIRDEDDAEIIRIISARRATRRERARYEQNRQKETG